MLGLTFKENCPDLRNSKVIDVIRELQSYGAVVTVHDPVADADEAMIHYGLAADRMGRSSARARFSRGGGAPVFSSTLGGRHTSKAYARRALRGREMPGGCGSVEGSRPISVATLTNALIRAFTKTRDTHTVGNRRLAVGALSPSYYSALSLATTVRLGCQA